MLSENCDLTSNGRIHSPPTQHTIGHLDCPACDAIRKDALAYDPDSLLCLDFKSGATLWLSTRKPYLKEPTYKEYEHNISTLSKFFGKLTLEKIHLGHLRQYQTARMGNVSQMWKRKAGPSIINHELSVVQQVLKRAGRWKHLAHHYEPLPLPPFQPRKVMSDKEEDRLFEIGASDPEFMLPLMVAYLSVNTTACGSELRHVKLAHIGLEADPPRLMIATEHAKNGFRGRVIPLNETAVVAMKKCLERAHKLGSVLPQHYLFPRRYTTGHWEPDKPASPAWLFKRWKAMREAADLPWITPHCLRHQAITRMLEFGVPTETVRNIAGHVSETMMRHYSHSRIATSSSALDMIDPRHRKAATHETSLKTRKSA